MKLTITNSPFASFALTALACIVLVPASITAQNMPTPDPACPPDTIVSTAFNMPNSTTCVLCSFIMEKCSASCSTFQFTTTSEEAGQCAISDGYQLVTRDVPFPMSGEEEDVEDDVEPELGFVVSAIAQEGMDGPNGDAPPTEDDTTSAASSTMVRSSIGASVFVAGAATIVTRMML